MANDQTLIERAFELARSGSCRGVHDIKIKLKADGFWGQEIDARLTGRSIVLQLQALCKAAR